MGRGSRTPCSFALLLLHPGRGVVNQTFVGGKRLRAMCIGAVWLECARFRAGTGICVRNLLTAAPLHSRPGPPCGGPTGPRSEGTAAAVRRFAVGGRSPRGRRTAVSAASATGQGGVVPFVRPRFSLHGEGGGRRATGGGHARDATRWRGGADDLNPPCTTAAAPAGARATSCDSLAPTRPRAPSAPAVAPRLLPAAESTSRGST